MLAGEITIDRPPYLVWAYFTTSDHWSEWSRLSLQNAHWQVGGKLFFEKGMTSVVEAIVPGASVTFADSWSAETWEFEAIQAGGTLVRVSETPRGMAYTDGGAGARAKTAKTLEKFKAAVEEAARDEGTSRFLPPEDHRDVAGDDGDTAEGGDADDA